MIKEERPSESFTYTYDNLGNLSKISYTSGSTTTNYYVVCNSRKDVEAIYDTSGVLQARYIYDAWGNSKVVDASNNEITSTSHIGNINPIRYRGYYYDSETNLYYLLSRYYDADTCRFISSDSVGYLEPEDVNGLNLYAYCLNNPIMYADPSGHSVSLILCAMALVGIGLTIGGTIIDNNIMTAVGLTMVAIPSIISGSLAILSGASYLSVIGGVTVGAGIGTGLFASAEYQEAITDQNWIKNTVVEDDLYSQLMLSTVTLATCGTLATNVLIGMGNAATPNQMMNSYHNNPNRWNTVKEIVEPSKGKNKGGVSTYSYYINKWTGSKMGIHQIIRDGIFIHGPHFHPWP